MRHHIVTFIVLLLSGCSVFKPHPRAFAHTYRDVTLSREKPSDAEFQVRLVQIASDGTVELEALPTGEMVKAHIGETFQFRSLNVYGIQLVSSSSEKFEAVITRNKCVSAK